MMAKQVVSVLDFGADPTGRTDSTGAFAQASDQARMAHLPMKVIQGTAVAPQSWGPDPVTHAGGLLQGAPLATVLVPEGVYRVQPWVEGTAGPIPWHSVRWVGEAAHREGRTTLVPASPQVSVADPLDRFFPKSALIHASGSRIDLEGILIDCEGQVDAGLFVDNSIGARFRHIGVENAAKTAAMIRSSEWVRAERLSASHSPIGIGIRACNGGSFIDPRAIECSEFGIEVRGDGASGIVSMVGVSVESRQGTAPKALVLVDGVQGGSFSFNYLHGGSVGIRLTGSTHAASFSGHGAVFGGSISYKSEEGPNQTETLDDEQMRHRILDIDSAHHCSFSGFAPASGVVFVNAEKSAQNQFFALSHGQDSIAYGNMPIVFENAAIGERWVAYERDGRLQAYRPPTIGWWPAGQVVENINPDSNRPMGWVYRRPKKTWIQLPEIP